MVKRNDKSSIGGKLKAFLERTEVMVQRERSETRCCLYKSKNDLIFEEVKC